jgi:hypothetical protein
MASADAPDDAIADLTRRLEAVSGHRDPEATGAEGNDSDGVDVRATGEPQP